MRRNNALKETVTEDNKGRGGDDMEAEPGKRTEKEQDKTAKKVKKKRKERGSHG